MGVRALIVSTKECLSYDKVSAQFFRTVASAQIIVIWRGGGLGRDYEYYRATAPVTCNDQSGLVGKEGTWAT